MNKSYIYIISCITSILILFINSCFFSNNIITIVSTICIILFLFLYVSSVKKNIDIFYKHVEKLIDLSIEGESEEFYNESIVSSISNKLSYLINLINVKNNENTKNRLQIERLVSDISHQTKTPISNIILYSEIIKERLDNIDDKLIEKSVDIILEQSHKLEWLVKILVDTSRLENGIIKCIKERTSIKELVNSAINEVKYLSEEKTIYIETNIKEDFILYIDPKWIKEMLVNILENAIKYTDVGYVLVKVYCLEYYVCIMVEDTGIGIDENERERIFDRFYRGKNVSSKKGIGLGLYIARNIIYKHEGYITIDSKLDIGSKFYIYLPNYLEINNLKDDH